MKVTWLATGAALVALVALASCGGDGGGGGETGTCNPSSTAAITISASGVSPTAVCVLPGGTVTFTNSDSAQHDIEPIGNCPALALGQLAPSESKTATFSSAQICTFEDADNAGNAAFQGTVAVSQTTTTGPGY